MTRKRVLYAILAASVLLSSSGKLFAQAAPDAAPVSREEFDKMMKEMKDLRQEVAQLKQERAAAATQPGATSTNSGEVAQLRQEVAALKKQQVQDQADAEERAAEVDKIDKDVMDATRANAGGQERLLITGDASVGFIAQRNSASTFLAEASPRFLWQINDRLQFDAALDIGIGSDSSGNESTSVDLTVASLTYLVNDYLVAGGGLFVSPFGAYHRDFDPPWIDKLPDDPLAFGDKSLGPQSILGAFIGGAVPISSTKVNYALYASNGPALQAASSDAGNLDWQNYTDMNGNKAVGGRIGFLPIPQLEIGYSFQYGEASTTTSPDNLGNVPVFAQDVDASYVAQIEKIGGQLTLRGEWVWTHVSTVTYDPTGTEGFGPLSFTNDSNGGYVLVAYRPTFASSKIVRNFEGVFRYDRINIPAAAPGGGTEQRYTFGLDYWFDPRAVLKVAYECDDVTNAAGSPAFMMQFGVGF
jgi:hypothetical protein